MSTDEHLKYLAEQLESPQFEKIRNKKISAIVTGSSADDRADEHSDWDFKIFTSDIEEKGSAEVGGCKFSISDSAHVPNAFVLVRSFDFLTSEFTDDFVVTLWICERAKILRDDDNCFKDLLLKEQVRFKKTLPELSRRKYLKLRTRRHGIDGMVKRSELLTAMMLAQDCIKTSLQILHLIEGTPYPYPQWLFTISRNMFCRKYPELFKSIEELSLAKDCEQIRFESRNLVETLIDVLLTKGFNSAELQNWWLYI